MPNKEDQFINSLVQNSEQSQGSQTTESQIQERVTSGMPWWGWMLAGAGIFAAGKIGGGLARSIDLLAGEGLTAKAGITAAEAAAKYGTITAKDVTSTVFGKLSFTSRMIGKPNVFLSNKIFSKIPKAYDLLFNTKTIGTMAANAVNSIPGVQVAASKSADYLVGLKEKTSSINEVIRYISAATKARIAGISSMDAIDLFAKNASRNSGKMFERENYFVPQLVQQISKVTDVVKSADKSTAAEIKQSVNEYLQQRIAGINSKVKTLSFFGLKPVSYAEHSKMFNKNISGKLKATYESMKLLLGKESGLPQWEDLIKMPASPDLFTTQSGKLTYVYGAKKLAIDTTRKFLQNVNIPYLGFNPLTLLQPGFMEEMANQRFITELNSSNFVPYANGTSTVADIAKSLNVDISKAKMYIIGGKAYIHSPKTTVPIKQLGEVFALKSHNVSSAINRIYAFETGMYRGGIQKADMPFNQKNNVEGSLLEELKTSYNRITKAKLKRWNRALKGYDTVQDMLSTMAEMHNSNPRTMMWKLTAEKTGIYNLPLKTQLDMFNKYAKTSSKASREILGMEKTLNSKQRRNLYRFFSLSSKEKKLYDLIKDKGEEALTARYLNQGTAAGLKYRDILAIGTLKQRIAMISENKLEKTINAAKGLYSSKTLDTNNIVGELSALHVKTEAYKLKIANVSNMDNWINRYVEGNADKKQFLKNLKDLPFGILTNKFAIKYNSLAKQIYSQSTGSSFFEKMFNNLEHSTKNITKLSSRDYLVIGKYRAPWETKAQGGTLKDWLLQLSPTPSSFSKRSSIPGLMAHWLVERPYDLLEYTGLGRPNYSTTYNATSTIGSFFLRRILPVSATIAGVGYTSYLIHKYTGVDVKKDTFSVARRIGIGALRLGEYTGVTPSIRWIHQHYPGIISTGSFLYGQYIGNVRTAMIFGSMASFAENVPTARKTALSWYGVNQVPIRSGRWWELGSDPFQGGRTKYYRPSLAYLSTTNWQYTSTLWGSEKNYWKYGSMLPTPTNLFDVLPLFAKDKFLGRTHRADRPYGFTDSGIMNSPTDQKLRQSTGIGAVYGGVNAIASYKKSDAISTQTIKQIQTTASVIRAKSIKASLGYIGKYIEEYPGMPGFVGGSLLKTLTGNKRYMYLASPSYMGSLYRQYYQKELGSLFGMSELLRRMIPNQHPWYSTITGNIRNTQPQWLPDRFQYGDPYAQLEFGEVRLPGEAYLATHPLANGEYTPAQQMQIAANVSPRSSAYDKVVSELKSRPPTTAGERYTMYTSAKEHEDILMGNAKPFSPYSIKLTREKIQLGKYIGNGVFENPKNKNAAIMFAGVQPSVDAVAANLFQTKNITLSEAYSEAQQKIKKIDETLNNFSGKSVEAIVPADEGARYRMLMSGGLVEEIYNKAATKELLGLGAMPTDNTTMSYFAAHHAFGSSIWDKFRHTDSFYIQKFGGTENALEYYKRHLYSGALFQNWSSPISSFLLPAILKPTGESFTNATSSAFYTGMFGSVNPIEAAPAVSALSLFSGLMSLLPNIPTSENKKRIELENKYLLSEYYLGKNNLFGNQLPSLKDIEKQLPQPESEYFSQFLNAPASSRSEISRIVPDAERYLLQEYWHLKDMDATGKLQASTVAPILPVVNKEESDQVLQDVSAQAQRLDLMMSRSSYTDQISAALDAMHNQSMIQPIYSSASMDLAHKQKRGEEMAHYNGSQNTTIGYSGNNSLNVRRNYGR